MHPPRPLRSKFGAGNGVRTRDIKLGKLALYQLSYARLPETMVSQKHGVTPDWKLFTR